MPLAVEIAGRVVAHLAYFTDTEATVDGHGGRVALASSSRASGPNEMWFVVPDQGSGVNRRHYDVDGHLDRVRDRAGGRPAEAPS